MSKKIISLSVLASLVIGGFAGYMAKPDVELKFLEGNAGAIQWLVNSGESEALQYQAYNMATESLKMKANKETEKPKAVVLDIDETVLNNFGSVIGDYLTGETINLMIANSLHALITSHDELKEYDFEKMEKKPYLNYVW